MVFYHARDKFYFSETVNPPRTLYSYTGMSRTINIMTMEGQDSLTRKKNDYGCEIICGRNALIWNGVLKQTQLFTG